MPAKRKVSDTVGLGLVLPFRRLGAGLATGDGVEVVTTQLMIVLGTLCKGPKSHGQLPYNQRLGSLIQLLRHKSTADHLTRELATLYVTEKIKLHVKRARITKLSFESDFAKRTIVISVRFDILDREGGTPLISGVEERLSL